MTLLRYKPLPLVDIAAIRLVGNLFKESSVLLSISDFHSKYSPYDADDYEGSSKEYERLLNIQKVWEETVLVVLLNESSKLVLLHKQKLEELNHIVGQMGRRVKKWKEFHEKYLCISNRELCYFDVPVLQKLRWTTSGEVDYLKTALEIICSDVLDIVKKFKLACLYCLEYYIKIFWEELPIAEKRYFWSKEEYRLRTGGLGQEFWWPYIIQEQETILDDLTRPYRTHGVTFHHYAFLCSVLKGNKIAAKHFLRKLTNEEKMTSIMRAAKSIKKRYYMQHGKYLVFPVKKCFEQLSYLLSLMTRDQQREFLLQNPLAVLERFLFWPLQDMFLEIADNIWENLPDENRDNMLFFMYENSERVGENSLKFQEFFLRIHPSFWFGFVDRQTAPRSYFRVEFVKRGVKPLEICFRSLHDATARKRLIFSEVAINTFKKYISEGKEDTVVACLQDAGLSQEDRKVLKETLHIGEMKTRKRSGLHNLLADDGKR